MVVAILGVVAGETVSQLLFHDGQSGSLPPAPV